MRLIKRNIKYSQYRNGEKYQDILGLEDTINGTINLPIDTDIIEGDIVSRVLPNGNLVERIIVDVVSIEPSKTFGRQSLLEDAIIVEARDYSKPKIRILKDKIEISSLHKDISNVSARLFDDEHFDQSVMEAFKKIEHRVQSISKIDESGTSLMAKAFAENNTTLDMSISPGKNGESEKTGFKFLMMGAMSGIRNSKAHGESRQDLTREETLEYLAFASLLMRRLDLAESKINDN